MSNKQRKAFEAIFPPENNASVMGKAWNEARYEGYQAALASSAEEISVLKAELKEEQKRCDSYYDNWMAGEAELKAEIARLKRVVDEYAAGRKNDQ